MLGRNMLPNEVEILAARSRGENLVLDSINGRRASLPTWVFNTGCQRFGRAVVREVVLEAG